METLKGKGGVHIPRLGLGVWQMSTKETVSAALCALKNGLRHIDTAKIYENESAVGEALRLSKIDREKAFIATKLWREDLAGAAAAIKGIEQSLRRLKAEWLDLALIHWPFPGMDLKGSLEGLLKMKAQGKIRALGVSNFNAAMIQEACHISSEIAALQAEYHPLLSQNILLKESARRGMIFTAYSPLACGHIMKIKQLRLIGEKYGKTAAQIALRWLMDQKNIAAVFKSRSEERILSNMNIFDFQLEESDRRQIHKLARGRLRMINPPFAPAWDPE